MRSVVALALILIVGSNVFASEKRYSCNFKSVDSKEYELIFAYNGVWPYKLQGKVSIYKESIEVFQTKGRVIYGQEIDFDNKLATDYLLLGFDGTYVPAEYFQLMFSKNKLIARLKLSAVFENDGVQESSCKEDE
ncbi:MAG: hypothetical protein KDD61_06450 [Bdellovibrionales bacterium]|nr:hypothetical protein [Bdellovibrionales bacterium]